MQIGNPLKMGDGKAPENGKAPKQEGPKPASFLSNILTVIVILLALAYGYSYFADHKKAEQDTTVSLSQLALDIHNHAVNEVKVDGEDLTVLYNEVDQTTHANKTKTAKKEVEASLSDTFKNYGLTPEDLGSFKLTMVEPNGFAYWFEQLAPFVLPVLLFFFILWFMTRKTQQGPMQAFSFGQSKARIIYPDDTAQRVTFKDVAGAKEAKEELQEIVEFLKEPKKFLDIGAQIPKGVMLMGAPGTGKTLLARAVAGEAGVPFFHLSGSEFVEMFVGVGASRVRDLFHLAKKEAPAIIFVDEIDAVGRARGVGMGGGNDEREQTLNQILVEMDGFEPNEKVIVMAATNRPDVLDTALLRPGRFDRRVTLDLPDLSDREEILGVHVRNKKLGEDVVLHVIAERTPGFSGADLYSLVNEAAILAARENRKHVAQYDFIRSIEKVMIGPERRSHVLSDEEKKVTAYHEGGHALLSSLLPFADPVHKISIISRGHAAGYTLKLPDEERNFHTRNEFLDDIAVSLGGFVAEEMMFDDLTTGPSNDLAVATSIARDMVAKYGMSAHIGPVSFDQGGIPMLVRRGYEHDYSEDVAARIDTEVSRIMNEQLDRARKLLRQYKSVLDAIATALMEKETMERDEYEQLLVLHGIKPKKRHGDEAYTVSRSGVTGTAKPIVTKPVKTEQQIPPVQAPVSAPTPETPEEYVTPPGAGEMTAKVRHDSVAHTIVPNRKVRRFSKEKGTEGGEDVNKV